MPRPTPIRVRNHLCAGLKSRIARVRGGSHLRTACPCSTGDCSGWHCSDGYCADGDRADGGCADASCADASCATGDSWGYHYSGRRSFRCDRSGHDDGGTACVGRGSQRDDPDAVHGAGSVAGDRSSPLGLPTSRCILPRRSRGSYQQRSSARSAGHAAVGNAAVRNAAVGLGARAKVPGTGIARCARSGTSAGKHGRGVFAAHGLVQEMMFGRARCHGPHCRRDIWCRVG
jgi:hypothetical protein